MPDHSAQAETRRVFVDSPDVNTVDPVRAPGGRRTARQVLRAVARFWTARMQLRAGLLAACLLAVGTGAAGLTDEASVTLQGDMPRYLMNGVYFHDLAIDRPFGSVAELVEYTRLYYARYPALSLGHHPPLVSLAEAPMFAIFGVSVTSARLLIFFSFIVATAFLYLLVADIYGPLTGIVAGALFVTSPFVILTARSVLSEIPTLALVIVSAYCLHRFCVTENRRSLTGFVVAAVASLYAKQLAVFVFPALFAMVAIRLGPRRLFKRDFLLAVGAIALLALPLVPLTLVLSPSNVAFIIPKATRAVRVPHRVLLDAINAQFVTPVVLVALAGLVRAVVTKDRRSWLFVLWVASVLPGLLMFGYGDPQRYSIYWVPAICTLAASTATGWRNRLVGASVFLVVAIALSVQAVAASRTELVRAEGYEEAATFVVDSKPGPTVLFSGDVDSGFFTFFVRKHDPERRLVVLRSDKLLTTSFLWRMSVENRITAPDEIYGVLHTFGVKYIVIEDRKSQAYVLEWLRQELRSASFIERKRIRINSSEHRLRDTDLVVYEFLDATPPADDAVLSMNLPIIKSSLAVKLSDLIERKYLR